MTTLWTIATIVAVLVVVPNVVGLFLPEHYTGRATHRYERPASAVWAALMDRERHPMTGKALKAFEDQTEEGGLPTWVETMAGSERILVRTTESEEPRRLVREMESQGVPMTAHWEYTLEEQDGGSLLTIDANTWIRSGHWMVPMFRFMMVIGGGVKKGLDVQMEMVGASLGVD